MARDLCRWQYKDTARTSSFILLSITIIQTILLLQYHNFTMQFLPLALGLAHLFPTLVLGVPAPQSPTRVLQKREQASPVIGPGFTAQETKQLMDGIFDAMELAAYVRAVPKKTDEIFKNYFDEGDRKMVDSMSFRTGSCLLHTDRSRCF
jgi:hypothetical protein